MSGEAELKRKTIYPCLISSVVDLFTTPHGLAVFAACVFVHTLYCVLGFHRFLFCSRSFFQPLPSAVSLRSVYRTILVPCFGSVDGCELMPK